MSEYIYEHKPSGCDAFGNPVDLPTLVKREEIVRCRDCRNYHPDEGTLMRCRFKIEGFVQWRNAEPNGFCAWGERRDDESR